MDLHKSTTKKEKKVKRKKEKNIVNVNETVNVKSCK